MTILSSTTAIVRATSIEKTIAQGLITREMISFLRKKVLSLPPNENGFRVIAIGGSSGTGKSTISVKLAQALGNAAALEMDNWRSALPHANVTEEEFIEIIGVHRFKADLIKIMRERSIDNPPKFVVYKEYNQPMEYETAPLVLPKTVSVIIFNGLAALHERLLGLTQLKIHLYIKQRGLREEQIEERQRGTGPTHPRCRQC